MVYQYHPALYLMAMCVAMASRYTAFCSYLLFCFEASVEGSGLVDLSLRRRLLSELNVDTELTEAAYDFSDGDILFLNMVSISSWNNC